MAQIWGQWTKHFASQNDPDRIADNPDADHVGLGASVQTYATRPYYGSAKRASVTMVVVDDGATEDEDDYAKSLGKELAYLVDALERLADRTFGYS